MIRHSLHAVLAVLTIAVLASCAEQPQLQRPGTFDKGRVLFDPALAIQEDWIEMAFVGHTDYRIASSHDHLSIRAEGRRSASGLVLPVDFDAQTCPYLEWDWRVEQLQEDASLTEKDKEDVAASIYVMFGDPGSLSAPKPVPTLRYVWTTSRVPLETIVDSPYLPGVVRSIVVQTGIVSPLAWEHEKRDLVADYQAAFGSLPKDRVQAVAIYTDNDQTQEPVVAHYGAAHLLCAAGDSAS